MTRTTRQDVMQACPNCGRSHDVSVYVAGQKVTCSCGIRFEAVRADVSFTGAPTLRERPRDKATGLPPPIADTPAPAAVPAPVAAAPVAHSIPIELSLDRTVSSGGTSAQQLTTVALPVPKLPGYELEELLGRGGMGEVWRARQTSLSRAVAVKVLPERFAADKEFIARFEKEAAALAALSHPNIVQIIDRGQAGGHCFFAMELVSGRTLREVLSGPRPGPRDALKLGRQIAHAIDYAHEQHIVHRDLKPENVLVDSRGHVKVLDFGLAGMKQSEHNISLTATSVAMGTVNYMAPEQRRDAKNVDHRADLYSLGVVLYELITGELPIGRFKLPSERVLGVDTRVDEIVVRLLEPEPAARPQTAREVADLFDEVLAGTGSGPPSVPPLGPGSFGPAAGAPSQIVAGGRSAWKVSALALGALVAVGAVAALWPRDKGPVVAQQPPAWYTDTENELFSSFQADGDSLKLDFLAPTSGKGEELTTHSGHWKVADGALVATQWGDSTGHDDHPVVLPRAFVAHRYYSSDDVELEVEVDPQALPPEFPPLDASDQRFVEASFRFKDGLVSVFAVPKVGMRMGWRYTTNDARERNGNSSRDVETMTGDEASVPSTRFKMKLVLKKQKGGVSAEGYVNGVRFAHRLLDGFEAHTLMISLGCRNLRCQFTSVSARGKAAPKPAWADDTGAL